MGDPRWGTYVLVLGVGDEALLPSEYALHQNYPNPFNPTTTIRFDIVEQGHVTLNIYNLLGQRVGTLVNQQLDPGFHSVQWNASSIASGVYLYTIEMNNFAKSRKLLIIK
ncbi:MAG: T9SS type A sorting domain-containing protein, partial [Candidatus Marinimicrobia bacterium]|nr:T9SS type A sorting domain-containing protein [Candidatus Neomarinimicrobiota bacterium]